MVDFFESESFVLPSEVKSDVEGRLKNIDGIRSLEFQIKADALRNAKEFSDTLVSLRKKGVKITHEFTIKLAFPKTISREKTLTLVESMPKPVNGRIKVRIELDRSLEA